MDMKNEDLIIKANFERLKKISLWEMKSFNDAKAKRVDCELCKGKGYKAEVQVVKDRLGRNVNCHTVVRECSCLSNKKARS